MLYTSNKVFTESGSCIIAKMSKLLLCDKWRQKEWTVLSIMLILIRQLSIVKQHWCLGGWYGTYCCTFLVELLCEGSVIYHALPANWPEACHSCILLNWWPILDHGTPVYTMISTSCNWQSAVRVFLTRKAVSLAALLVYQHSFIILDTDCSAYKKIKQSC